VASSPPKRAKQPAPRSTDAEIGQRVNVVLGWLLNGDRRSVIVENAIKKWGIETAQADVYISKAKVIIQKEAEERRAIGFEFAMNALLEMVKGGDKQSRIRLGAIAELNKMLGNYAATNLNLKAEVTNSKEPDLSGLTFEQLYELRWKEKPQ